MIRPCRVVDMVYFILNAPLRILMSFVCKVVLDFNTFLLFLIIYTFNILLEPLTVHNKID